MSEQAASEATTKVFADALAEAIRARLTPAIGSKVFSVRTLDDGKVISHAVMADMVGMPPTGHLIFATKENLVVRIYAPNTWLLMRDMTAEGPESVAKFLADLEGEGAGTA